MSWLNDATEVVTKEDKQNKAVKAERETFKANRADTISRAVITTSYGNIFDADEPSQQRMARAILISNETGQTETRWILANNSVITVTKPEMVEALALSLQAQSEAWIPAAT